MTSMTTLESLVSPLPDVYGRLRVDGAFIYTADPQRPVLPNGSILIQGSTILAVGSSAEVDAAEASLGPTSGAKRRIDAFGKMILPGFVNNHWHEANALIALGSLDLDADDKNTLPNELAGGQNSPGVSVLFNKLFGLTRNLPPEMCYLFALRAYVSQLRSGATCVADFGSTNQPEHLERAALATGIRTTVSVLSVDGECNPAETGYSRLQDTDKILCRMEEVILRCKADVSGRLRAMPTVLWPLNASDELLKGAVALAEKYNTSWGTHLSAAPSESPTSQRYFGARSVERLQNLGVLSKRLISAHTSFLDDEEFAWLVEAGVNLTYSPQNYPLTGEASITANKMMVRFVQANAPVTASSDGDALPMGFMSEAMRTVWSVCNDSMLDPSFVPPTRALSMATRAPAESLGLLSDVGSLAVGKKADFMIVPIDDYRYDGVRRPLQSFLISGGSGDVETVVVDGRILVDKKTATFVDEKALSAAFLQSAAGLSQALKG